MIWTTHHLSPQLADELRNDIHKLNKAYWRDRSRFNPNLGLDNTAGQYYSCGKISCPKHLSNIISLLAPEYAGRELDDWVINWTPEGGYMPPHIDNEGYLEFAVLSLQSNSGAFIWYHNNDTSKPEYIADKAGQIIHIDDITQVHAVAPATMDRYVIIFLYR